MRLLLVDDNGKMIAGVELDAAAELELGLTLTYDAKRKLGTVSSPIVPPVIPGPSFGSPAYLSDDIVHFTRTSGTPGDRGTFKLNPDVTQVQSTVVDCPNVERSGSCPEIGDHVHTVDGAVYPVPSYFNGMDEVDRERNII